MHALCAQHVWDMSGTTKRQLCVIFILLRVCTYGTDTVKAVCSYVCVMWFYEFWYENENRCVMVKIKAAKINKQTLLSKTTSPITEVTTNVYAVMIFESSTCLV